MNTSNIIHWWIGNTAGQYQTSIVPSIRYMTPLDAYMMFSIIIKIRMKVLTFLSPWIMIPSFKCHKRRSEAEREPSRANVMDLSSNKVL